MAATFVIATLFLFFSGSEAEPQVGEPLAEIPAVQKLFIEVHVVPIIVEEPLDQIEPLFVEEAESVIAEDCVADQIAPLAEPVAEPVQTVEPESVAVPDSVPEAAAEVEQKTGEELLTIPSADADSPVILDAAPSDAITPMIIENTDIILIPQIDAISETVVSPSVETTEPAQPPADALETVEPVSNEPITNEPVAEEKTETGPAAPSHRFEAAASEPETAANPSQAVEPSVVQECQNGAVADQSAIDESVSGSDDAAMEPVADPFEVVEPAIDEDAPIETQPEEEPA